MTAWKERESGNLLPAHLSDLPSVAVSGTQRVLVDCVHVTNGKEGTEFDLCSDDPLLVRAKPIHVSEL